MKEGVHFFVSTNVAKVLLDRFNAFVKDVDYEYKLEQFFAYPVALLKLKPKERPHYRKWRKD